MRSQKGAPGGLGGLSWSAFPGKFYPLHEFTAYPEADEGAMDTPYTQWITAQLLNFEELTSEFTYAPFRIHALYLAISKCSCLYLGYCRSQIFYRLEGKAEIIYSQLNNQWC